MQHILIIDDDPVTCMMLRRVLERQGYGVTVAPDGQAGIELAQSIRPALVICDWMMPVMDGIEVCRVLKADSSLSTTFFILLTSRGDLEDRIAGLNAGADEFLSKPIDANELKARVRAGLRLYQLSQDLKQLNVALQQETPASRTGASGGGQLRPLYFARPDGSALHDPLSIRAFKSVRRGLFRLFLDYAGTAGDLSARCFGPRP